MARNINVNTISGVYNDQTNLFPIIQTTLAADLSSVGVTGVGLPQIAILGIHGVSSADITMQLSDFSKVRSIANLTSSSYLFETGVYSDNLHIAIDRLVITTATPSASTAIKLNYYYEPMLK